MKTLLLNQRASYPIWPPRWPGALGRLLWAWGAATIGISIGVTVCAQGTFTQFSFTPTHGTHRTAVTLTGPGLGSVTRVQFDGTIASISVDAENDTVTAWVPAGAKTGRIRISGGSNGAESATDFVIERNVPIVGHFTPRGPVGSGVWITLNEPREITGVRFGDRSAAFWFVEVPLAQAVMALVPPGATDGPLTVVTTLGTFATETNFVVTEQSDSAQKITQIIPNTAPPGHEIFVSGPGLALPVLSARIGSQAARFQRVLDGLVLTVPDSATSGPIEIVTLAGLLRSGSDFIVAPEDDRLPRATVLGLSPTRVITGRPFPITLWGIHFAEDMVVRFNGVAGTGLDFEGPNTVRVQLPSDTTTGPITVETSAGVTVVDRTFVVGEPSHAVASIRPLIGAPGITVLLLFHDATEVKAVRFAGGVNAPFVSSPFGPPGAGVVAVVPPGAKTGPITIVTAEGEIVTPQEFLVLDDFFQYPQRLARMLPEQGPVGRSVMLQTEGLAGAVAGVQFNGVDAPFRLTPGGIVATVPPGSRTGPVLVYAATGAVVSRLPFTVTGDPIPLGPEFLGFSPAEGREGEEIDLLGFELTSAEKVEFNGTPTTFAPSWTGNGLTARVPQGAVSGPITITTPAGVLTHVQSFNSRSPQLKSFAPLRDHVQARVSLFGLNLAQATKVSFGGRVADFSVVSAEELVATVPTNAVTGTIVVETPDGSVNTGTNQFGVIPKLTGLSAPKAPVETKVRLFGTGLSDVTRVEFSGQRATFTIRNAAEIEATIPLAATNGPVKITAPGGEAFSAEPFVIEESRDLVILNSQLPSNLEASESLTYAVTVRNRGPAHATGVHVRFHRPKGAVIGQLSMGRGTAKELADSLDWEIGELANGASVRGLIEVQLNMPGTLSFVSSVSSHEPDRNEANNVSRAKMVVTPPAAKPTLNVHIDDDGSIVLTWAEIDPELRLESFDFSAAPPAWQRVPAEPTRDGKTLTLRMPATGIQAIFRLAKP